MASPAVGRLRTGRPGETKAQPKLVDALTGASADAGSIPAASTSRLRHLPQLVTGVVDVVESSTLALVS
jgi:hypothetical protein